MQKTSMHSYVHTYIHTYIHTQRKKSDEGSGDDEDDEEEAECEDDENDVENPELVKEGEENATLTAEKNLEVLQSRVNFYAAAVQFINTIHKVRVICTQTNHTHTTHTHLHTCCCCAVHQYHA